MRKFGDGASLEDIQERCIGGTVLVWVLDPMDIGIAQDIARTLCRSVGLDAEASLMTLSEVAEKGSSLLEPKKGGLLMLCPRGAGILVHAVDSLRAGPQ